MCRSNKYIWRKQSANILAAVFLIVAALQCSQTWDRLFTKFKEIYCSQKNIPSGSAAYTITWPYYEKMCFLIDHIEHRSVLSSLNPLRMHLQNINSQAGTSNRGIKRQRTPEVPQKKPEVPKKKLEVPQRKPEVPEWDSFAKKQRAEISQVDELLGNLQNAVNHNSQNLLGVLKEIKEKPDGDKYFSILLSHLQKIDPQDLDKCFITLLEDIENFKTVKKFINSYYYYSYYYY